MIRSAASLVRCRRSIRRSKEKFTMTTSDSPHNQHEREASKFFDGLSGVARYIRMYFGETQQLLGSGTCFFVMSADGPVLVTNRHNFTGRNNLTGEVIHKQGGIPDHAVVTLHGPDEVHYHIDLVDHANPESRRGRSILRWAPRRTSLRCLSRRWPISLERETASLWRTTGTDGTSGSELHVTDTPTGRWQARSQFGRRASSRRNPT